MKKYIIILAGLMLCLSADLYSQGVKNSGTLTFNITGLADNSGQVLVQLFQKGNRIPAEPFREVTAKINGTEAVVVIENLPYGLYGAILVHDQNANGMIDHKWGIPNEPLGYTNNWKLTLFSGMPTFDKLKFSFNQLKDHIPITFNK